GSSGWLTPNRRSDEPGGPPAPAANRPTDRERLGPGVPGGRGRTRGTGAAARIAGRRGARGRRATLGPLVAAARARPHARPGLGAAARDRGSPADSVSRLAARVEHLIAGRVRPDRQTAARSAFLAPGAVLAFPVVGASRLHGSDIPGGYLLDMQRALGRGDTAAARARYARVRAVRRARPPTDVDISSTYGEAWVFLGLRDTAAAVAVLDSSLNNLTGLGGNLLDFVPQAA